MPGKEIFVIRVFLYIYITIQIIKFYNFMSRQCT
jgi:hypothetical protein